MLLRTLSSVGQMYTRISFFVLHFSPAGRKRRTKKQCTMLPQAIGTLLQNCSPVTRDRYLHRIANRHIVCGVYKRVGFQQTLLGGNWRTMTSDQADQRRVFTSASLGHTAYRSWAQQARHERRFNIARLFEALGASKLVRAEQAFRQLDETGATAGNVDRALAGLEPEAIATGPITGTNPLARDMLMRAQRAIGENRDLRADELADIYVCSTCGNLREGQLTGACPICGSVPEAHKAFRAIEGMGMLGPHALMAFLEHSEEGLRKLFHDVDEDLLVRRQSDDRPSLKELL